MRFLVKSPLEHDSVAYDVGAVVELTEAQAAVMPWAVEPAPLAPVPVVAPVPEAKKQPEPSKSSK